MLRDGSQRLEMQVTVDNRVPKIIACGCAFQPGWMVSCAEASSAMQFDVMTRPTQPEPIVPGEWWMETPPETFPMHTWMDVHGTTEPSDIAGLCVIAEGVYEFGVEDDEIALTLLRAVGYLGAAQDPTTIIGGAGPAIATPEAQLQQKLSYRIALYPHGGDWQSSKVWQHAQAFLTPPRSITTVPSVGELPPTQSGFQVEGATMSSLKQSEDGQAVILRLFNATNEPTTGRIRCPVPFTAAYLADLNEHPHTHLTSDDDRTLEIELPQKAIITLRLEP